VPERFLCVVVCWCAGGGGGRTGPPPAQRRRDTLPDDIAALTELKKHEKVSTATQQQRNTAAHVGCSSIKQQTQPGISTSTCAAGVWRHSVATQLPKSWLVCMCMLNRSWGHFSPSRVTACVCLLCRCVCLQQVTCLYYDPQTQQVG
jgi:hypothetical protein